MNKFRLGISVLAISIFTFALASFAQAQSTRTWVSGVGDDVNPCSRTAPCKTFAGAFAKTFTHGEIDALDPGSYGTLTITKSITVDGTGTLAQTLAGGINGFTINIAANVNDPNREVTIRGLTINGSGASGAVGTRTGINGIRVVTNGAASVHIQNTIIQNFTQDCININATGVNVTVDNSQLKACSGAGILATSSSGLARVTVRNSLITNNGTGVIARQNSRVAMVDSTVAFNGAGVLVEGNGATAVAVLTHCQIANNTGIGIQAGSVAATNTSVARIADNIINNNAGSAVSIQLNGSIETFGDNKIIGNNPDGCVGCTSISGNIN